MSSGGEGVRLDELKADIERGFAGAEIYVSGDGRHFQVIVVSDEFDGKTMVQQHRLVYATLGDKVGNDIHALSVNTYTRRQWQQHKQSSGNIQPD